MSGTKRCSRLLVCTYVCFLFNSRTAALGLYPEKEATKSCRIVVNRKNDSSGAHVDTHKIHTRPAMSAQNIYVGVLCITLSQRKWHPGIMYFSFYQLVCNNCGKLKNWYFVLVIVLMDCESNFF